MKTSFGKKLAAFFGITKKTRIGAWSVVVSLLLLVAVIVVNALVGLIPDRIAKPDVTGSQTFRISGKTVDYLAALEEPVTLYFLCDGGKASADGDLYLFLRKYEDASDKITLTVLDPSSDPTFVSDHAADGLSDRSVIVESGRRYRLLDSTDLFYYYNESLKSNLTPTEYNAYVSTIRNDEELMAQGMLEYFISSTTAYFDGEARLTNAIHFVTRTDIPVAYVLSGNGCSALDFSLRSTLTLNSYDLRGLTILDAVPNDCDILIINAPSVDLSGAEAHTLSAYLEAGGKLVLTTSYLKTDLPNLASVLDDYGLGFAEKRNIICEGNPNYYLNEQYPFYLIARVKGEHPVAEGFTGTFVAMTAHCITIAETLPENVTVTPLLYTSAAAYLTEYEANSAQPEVSPDKAIYNFGVTAEKGESKILWISTPQSLTAQVNSYSEDSGNFTLTVSALNWMSGIANDSIAIESAVLNTDTLSVSAAAFVGWSVVLVILLPGIFIAAGIIIWYIRKKR